MTPSWMAPTIAIAPMQTVRSWSQRPQTARLWHCRFLITIRRQNAQPSSILKSSPMTVPMARHRTINMGRPAADGSRLSGFIHRDLQHVIHGATIAIKSTLIPQTLQIASCCSSLKGGLQSVLLFRTTTAAVLINVPVPGILSYLLSS